jgi:hypothetical protein
MRHEDHSRLVTLGENLAALAQTGAMMAIGAGSLARAVIGAPFREPQQGCSCSCGSARHRCCYDPPVYRCGGC